MLQKLGRRFLVLVAVGATIVFLFPQSITGQSISLVNTTGNTMYYPGSSVSLLARIEDPVYLRISDNLSAYRKLKIGYSPTNIYGPMVNPVAGGNTMLEITLCNFGPSIDWNKIQVRPQAISANPLKLGPYVTAAGGIGKSWTTISIPLADFDPLINFSSISYIEVPYSTYTGVMDIGISSIRFTGGSAPFTWFGPEHYDNIHNGNGGSGELTASLVTPDAGGIQVSEVDFYCGDEFIGYSTGMPYTQDWTAITAGDFSFKAMAYLADGTQLISEPVIVKIAELKESELNVQIISPIASGAYLVTDEVSLSASVSGIREPEPAWIRVTNSQSGTRKLKIGYHPTNLYAPLQNVIAGGNTIMEITLNDRLGNMDWSKVQIRPQGKTVSPVFLQPYITEAGGVTGQWKTISIPLSAFDPSINFSAISLIEMPYSLGLTGFELGIRSIRFTGGTTPFVWFGDEKTDNSMNGNGGPGELMAAVNPPLPAGARPASIGFYIDGELTETTHLAPYERIWSGISAGTHVIQAELTDNEGNTKLSEPVTFEVGDISPGTVQIHLTFSAQPANLTVEKATLRYDKDFAYSFSMDDGLIDAYTVAFPFLHGGLVTGNNTQYPGLFFSDGCGNLIPFSAGISWNSVNSSGKDLHVNTPGYVTWTQLSELANHGWNVFNHTWSHAAYSTTIDYDFQILENQRMVKEKTGIDMRHFVIPSGDQNYIAPAFANGMLTVMGNNYTFRGSPEGYAVDQPLDYANFRLYRRLLADDNLNEGNILMKLDAVAEKSVDGNHFWWSDFTHHVGFQATGASILFPLFEYYMNNVESKYGQKGADNMWMAPMQDVYEYLSVRDHSAVTWKISGNEVVVEVDYSQVPSGVDTGSLSLVVGSDQDFTDVRVYGSTNYSFRGSGEKKLINLEWGMKDLKSGRRVQPETANPIEIPVASEIKVWPNPFQDRLTIGFSEQVEGEVRLVMTDLEGKIAFDKMVGMNELGTTLELAVPDADLRPGVYLVTVIGNGTRYGSVKVVKF